MPGAGHAFGISRLVCGVTSSNRRRHYLTCQARRPPVGDKALPVAARVPSESRRLDRRESH